MNELLAAYRDTTNNWELIGASKTCGCCNCLQVFPADEVVAWSGLDMNNLNDPKAIARQSAMCPRCGSESVLGDKSGYPITASFLGRMNAAWFQRTIIHRPAPKK